MSQKSPSKSEVKPADVAAHIERLLRLRVEHSKMETSELYALNSIYEHEVGCMSALVGPTGVGKTTLLDLLAERILEKMPPKSMSDVPVVKIQLKANEEGPFNWKDFYRRLLGETNPPLAGELEMHRSRPAIPGNKATGDDLRRATEDSFRLRNTKVVFLDEAHHIALGKVGGAAMEDQLERLKSFANMTKVHLVLCGPYRLLPWVDLSGQLARRITCVHFPRYQYTMEDLDSLNEAIFTLIEDMSPWTLAMDLNESTIDYFFERSLGCFGILKPWLIRAAQRSASEGTWTISRAHLDRTCLRMKSLDIILDDILSGEKQLSESDANWANLKRRLGTGRFIQTNSPNGNGAKQAENGPEAKHDNGANGAANGKNGNRGGLRPGTRKPERDNTGLPEELRGVTVKSQPAQ